VISFSVSFFLLCIFFFCAKINEVMIPWFDSVVINRHIMKTCKKCNSEFEIKLKKTDLFDSFGLPEPTICHLCSWKEKMQWENEYRIYKRKCSLTGEPIISIYREDAPFPVYKRKLWLGDSWELPEMQYERERIFWDQYDELSSKVPRPNVIQVGEENSEYAHLTFDSKNCYLSFQSFRSGKLICCYRSISLNDSANCFFCSDSELLTECANCQDCYGLKYCQNSENCHDSAFLYDCKGCSNCFMCWNLRGKEYCFMNKRLSKGDYEAKIAEIDISTLEGVEMTRKEFEKQKPNFIVRSNYMVNCEGCVGDYLVNSKGCDESYFTNGSEDSSCMMRGTEMKDSYDSFAGGLVEVSYNVLQLGWCYHCAFCNGSNNCNECMFCEYCEGCQDCIGCIGSKKGKYLIFNKQYSEADYLELKKHISKEMCENGDAEKFFDSNNSPFDYGETVADLYFPESGDSDVDKAMGMSSSGDACSSCGKNFNITDVEIAYYKKNGVPAPTECFYCRIKRLAVPYSVVQMRAGHCVKCDENISVPDLAEDFGKRYCEKCYLGEVY